MSKKLILTAVALTATVISLAYCAGKKKGFAMAKEEESYGDCDCEREFCEENCSECDKCEETDCLTEADYENKND